MRGRAWSFARTGARRSRASGAASMCSTILTGHFSPEYCSRVEPRKQFLVHKPQSRPVCFPLSSNWGAVRAYAWYPNDRGYRLQGAADLPRFVQESVKAGVPAQWYSGLRAVGPLATFDATDSWVNHPYKSGVALIGDAAATSDPSHGQGQSLTLRDARVLRDKLLAGDNWDTAAHSYAEEHDGYFANVLKFYRWFWEILYDPGPNGEANRARALPRLFQDLSRMPDALVSGPEVPLDEMARRRFFGEG